MIKIIIEVTEKNVGYSFEEENVTLSEVVLANLKLDEAKEYLLGFEFESKFEIKEGYDEEEEEP